MLEVHCTGTFEEIGFQHGKAAREEIMRGMRFYKEYYFEKSRIEWAEARLVATRFMPLLERDWPDFITEMRGVASGAGLDFEDILALNVRSEIAMGMMTDGCTSFSWTTPTTTILAQNWDWDVRQQHNLVALTIDLPDGLRIAQITEAGIIGKIGLNSAGVGVCLNAIRCKGVSFDRLPLHLALRVALSAPSADIADAQLKQAGVATAGHILMADTSGGISTEWTAVGMQQISGPVLTHSNHFLMPQDPSVKELSSADSRNRVIRIKQLLDTDRAPGEEMDIVSAEKILEDEQGWPGAINRSVGDYSTTATLFGIVMDLRAGYAKVRVGRPTEAISSLTLSVK